jgi:pSer/pThr/pTyr-binding forkhead associated (FHA) protein
MAGPLEFEISRPGEPTVGYSLQQPFLILGRDLGNHLCLASEQVSRKHAYLQVIGGHVFFADLSSREGILLSNRQSPQGWLLPSTPITVTPFTIRLLGGSGPEAAVLASPPGLLPTRKVRSGDPLAPGVTLEINKQSRQIRWRVNRVLTLLGSESACMVRLPDRGMSRFHCSLLHTPQGLWVIDLLSRRGIHVNGEQVPWARLGDGDRVQVGPFELRAWYDKTEERSSSEADTAGRYALQPVAALERARLSPQLVPTGPGAILQPQPAMLQTVVEKFEVMQEEMFDQFRQVVQILVDAIGTQHREMKKDLLAQMEEVTRLTQEVRQLETQLREGPTAGGPSVPPSRLPPCSEVREPDGLLAGTPEAPQEDTPSPLPPFSAPSSGPEQAKSASGPPLDASIHLWLQQRIEQLNAQRKGSWQRILERLFGR